MNTASSIRKRLPPSCANMQPETDKEIAVASQKYLASQYKAEVERWGEFDQKRWDAFYDWLYENKVIAKEIPDGKGFTNDYLN